MAVPGLLKFNLCLMRFQIRNDITDGDKLSVVIFVDFNVIFGFAGENEIGKFQRIDTEIGDELCLRRDICFVDVHLLDEKCFEFFKHGVWILSVL